MAMSEGWPSLYASKTRAIVTLLVLMCTLRRMGKGFTLLVVSLVLCGRVENHISAKEQNFP